MSALVTRLHAYLHWSAEDGHERVEVPPFVAYLHPREDLVYFNYAIPVGDPGNVVSASLERLVAAFRARSRTPRLEFLEEVAPTLARALRDAGFSEALRTPLMTCARRDLKDPPRVPGLEVERLSPEAPDRALADVIRIRRAAFRSGGPKVEREAVDEMRRRLALGAAEVVARLDGSPVAAASTTPPGMGLAEVGGVATAEEHRRRGIGAVVMAEATRAAFESGAEVAFLTPGDEGAMRLYERAGYAGVATMLHYVLAQKG